MRLVPDEGPRAARIVLIGEAPGQHEDAQGRPFVGPSGHELGRWWAEAGLRRQDIYITNVVPYRPPNNVIGTVPKGEIDGYTDALHAKLATLNDPWLLVPTGNTALQALTGMRSITKHRGSIYEYVDRRGRRVKVIPTIHPAAIFRQWQWRRRCLADWHRIAADSQFRDLRLPEREHAIKPTLSDVADFVADARERAEVLAFDIETPRKLTFVPGRVLKSGKQTWLRRRGTRRITCIGFAFEPHFSLTVPTTEEYWGAQLDEVLDLVREALTLPCAKAAQNGGFDRWWLAQPEYAMPVTNYQWDTRWMSHAMDPLDAHDLAYQASVWTREPYWKDDCLLGETEILTPDGWQRLDMCPDDIQALQWSPDQSLYWAAATLVRKPYTGPMVRLSLRGHECSYTPTHRVPIESPRTAFQVEPIEKARHRATFNLPVAGRIVGGIAYDDDFVRLLVAIQADAKLGRRVARFTLKRYDKMLRLGEILARLGITPKHYNAPPSYLVLTVRGPEVEAISALLGAGNDKRFGPWLMTWNIRALDTFVRELEFWDGWRPPRKRHWEYFSVYEENIRWAATAAALCGYATNATTSDELHWRLAIKPRSWVVVQGPRGHATDYEHDGMVYCLRTVTGFFLARSHGQIFVTGNSKEKNDEGEPVASDIETFWRYCGKDAAVTRELVAVHHARLVETGRLGVYQKTYQALAEPLCVLGLVGLRMDDTARRRTSARLLADTIRHQDELAAIAGEPLYGAKGSLSTKKLTRFLYETLHLPAQRSRDTGALAANETVVRRLALKHPQTLGTGDDDGIAAQILRVRRLSALQKFVSDTVTDADGRLRSSWGFTYTLRFASSKCPKGTGANAQNFDRELLHLIIPEPGQIFLEVDLSQAEDRVVKMLTRAPRLIERARLAPWENDEHKRAAALIFLIDDPAITKPQRDIGKRTRHAGNYGLGGKTFSDNLLKDGYVYTPDQCDDFIRTILDQDTPEVREWQREVRAQVLRDKALTTTWGTVLPLEHERVSDDLYRQCYAYEPQQTVSLITKLWGLVPLAEYIAERGLAARIVNEKHDTLLISTPPGEAWEVAQFLRGMLERPRTYRGHAMTIPVEVKLGASWAMAHEWKRWPGRREFEEAAFGLT